MKEERIRDDKMMCEKERERKRKGVKGGNCRVTECETRECKTRKEA